MAARTKDEYVSIRMARFLMRIVGFWTSETRTEERVLKGVLGYTLFAIVLALWIEAIEFYFSVDDFYVSTDLGDSHRTTKLRGVVLHLVDMK